MIVIQTNRAPEYRFLLQSIGYLHLMFKKHRTIETETGSSLPLLTSYIAMEMCRHGRWTPIQYFSYIFYDKHDRVLHGGYHLVDEYNVELKFLLALSWHKGRLFTCVDASRLGRNRADGLPANHRELFRGRIRVDLLHQSLPPTGFEPGDVRCT